MWNRVEDNLLEETITNMIPLNHDNPVGFFLESGSGTHTVTEDPSMSAAFFGEIDMGFSVYICWHSTVNTGHLPSLCI